MKPQCHLHLYSVSQVYVSLHEQHIVAISQSDLYSPLLPTILAIPMRHYLRPVFRLFGSLHFVATGARWKSTFSHTRLAIPIRHYLRSVLPTRWSHHFTASSTRRKTTELAAVMRNWALQRLFRPGLTQVTGRLQTIFGTLFAHQVLCTSSPFENCYIELVCCFEPSV